MQRQMSDSTTSLRPMECMAVVVCASLKAWGRMDAKSFGKAGEDSFCTGPRQLPDHLLDLCSRRS